MTGHDEYKKLGYDSMFKVMRKKPIIIDGRNIFDKDKAIKKGFVYRGVGNL
jgi:UDP-N-acetyl-D-mannosaminuronate dehydrogenase